MKRFSYLLQYVAGIAGVLFYIAYFATGDQLTLLWACVATYISAMEIRLRKLGSV
jgi:hypothetical protein